MAVREPTDNRRGEVLRAAKEFYKAGGGPNAIDGSKDGSFCIHDMAGAVPRLVSQQRPEYTQIYDILRTLEINGSIVKLMHRYPCGTLARNHSYFRYNDPFKKSVPKEPGTVVHECKPGVDTKSVDIGSGRVREINIKISDSEIELNIKKG